QALARGVEGPVGEVLPAVDADVGVAGSGPGDHVGIAVAVDVADGHVGADVELQGVGEELGDQTLAAGVELALGDVLTGVDVDVGVAGGGAGNDVGVAVVLDVAGGDVGADVEVQAVGEELGQQAGAGVGGIEGAVSEGLAVVDADVRVAGGGRDDQVLVAVAVDVGHGHGDAAAVGRSEGLEVSQQAAVAVPANLHAPPGARHRAVAEADRFNQGGRGAGAEGGPSLRAPVVHRRYRLVAYD